MGKDHATKMMHQGGGAIGFMFVVAWFGALVYFINTAQGFWEVVLAFFQACVWPAIVLYHILSLLGA